MEGEEEEEDSKMNENVEPVNAQLSLLAFSNMVEEKLNVHDTYIPSISQAVLQHRHDKKIAEERQIRMQHNFTPKMPMSTGKVPNSDSRQIYHNIKEADRARREQLEAPVVLNP
jgi:hypothetical protein